MNFRRGRAREEPEINLIPLIDVLMVVLIFLFVTTTYSQQSQLQVNLPQADAEKTSNLPKIINVAVDASGRYAVDGQVQNVAEPAQLALSLRNAAKEVKEPVIAISADAQATHQAVVNVMEAARLAGYTQISFTTQKAQK
jgi:biopolymer transport protein ExbD